MAVTRFMPVVSLMPLTIWCRCAGLLLVASAVASVGLNPAQAGPMAPVVLPQGAAKAQPAALAPALPSEQDYLQTASQRYSTEVADDENLSPQLRKPESPKGASIWTIGF